MGKGPRVDSKMCSGLVRASRTRIQPIIKPLRHFAHFVTRYWDGNAVYTPTKITEFLPLSVCGTSQCGKEEEEVSPFHKQQPGNLLSGADTETQAIWYQVLGNAEMLKPGTPSYEHQVQRRDAIVLIHHSYNSYLLSHPCWHLPTWEGTNTKLYLQGFVGDFLRCSLGSSKLSPQTKTCLSNAKKKSSPSL